MSETSSTTRASNRPASGPSLPATAKGDYQLLDSGNMRKLEQVGPYLMVRPAPQAIWPPRLPQSAWQRAVAVYERDNTGGGNWQFRGTVKREYDILFDSLSLRIKLTDFGHLGLFPEQGPNWIWLRDLIRRRLQHSNNRNLHVLNLFGYTGGSTLAASQAGAHVVHVDAAKGVVDWARRNTEISRLQDRPVRWLVDDALKFVKREARRASRYEGIILDPPSFGRGPKGEVFKIEDDLLPLLEECKTLLSNEPLFILYSGHTPGFTPLVMYNQLATIAPKGGMIEQGEMVVVDQQGRPLPSGTFARWSASDKPTSKPSDKPSEKPTGKAAD